MSGISIFSGDENTKFNRLQINFWVYKPSSTIFEKLSGTENTFLDIGIEVEAGDKDDISIFFPCEFSLDSFSCIGKTLKEKALADVLFNDSCQISVGEADLHSFSITTSDKTLKVCTFDKSTFSSLKIDGGTLVTLPLQKADISRYVRVRLDSDTVIKMFSENTQPLGSWLQSIRTKNREIDFRINSIRSIPQKIIEDDSKVLSEFKVIHFFYIASSEESVLFQNIKLTSARFLERGVWDDYFNSKLNSSVKICAHHWKFKDENEISLFFRVNYPSTNYLTVAYYVLFTALFALAVNLTSSYIFSNLTEDENPVVNLEGDANKPATQAKGK